MNRRDAIEKITLMMGGVLAAPLLAGAMGEKLNFGPSFNFTPEQETLLAEVADVIIPATGTPGAKEAGVEKFITRVVRDCYQLEEQKKFYAGLDKLDKDSKDAHGKGFAALDAAQKTDMIKRTTTADKPFFLQMKGLTVTGYFTSEIGATKALDYLPIPGRFDGSYPMQKGQKSWAI
jgi:hypothetical protein